MGHESPFSRRPLYNFWAFLVCSTISYDENYLNFKEGNFQGTQIKSLKGPARNFLSPRGPVPMPLDVYGLPKKAMFSYIPGIVFTKIQNFMNYGSHVFSLTLKDCSLSTSVFIL